MKQDNNEPGSDARPQQTPELSAFDRIAREMVQPAREEPEMVQATRGEPPMSQGAREEPGPSTATPEQSPLDRFKAQHGPRGQESSQLAERAEHSVAEEASPSQAAEPRFRDHVKHAVRPDGALANIADRSTGWVATQVHAAGQDFVSRVLLAESYTPPEPGKDHDKDTGFDR